MKTIKLLLEEKVFENLIDFSKPITLLFYQKLLFPKSRSFFKNMLFTPMMSIIAVYHNQKEDN